MNVEEVKDAQDESASEFIAVGKESHTERAIFSIKSGDESQKGVYLDTCVAILTIDQPDKFWIFWLAPLQVEENSSSTASGVKGHTASGRKTPEEYGKDVLRGFRQDLLAAGFPQRKLHAAKSMDEAFLILTKKLNMVNQSAQNVIAYLNKN